MRKEKKLAKKTAQKLVEDNVGGAKLKMKPKHKRWHGSLSGTVQKIFGEATTEAMGSTFQAIIISFHLKQKFGKDPYEILLGDPKCFYNGLREVLGEGAEAVINLVGTYITAKYNVNCTAEEFVKLFTRNGRSSAQKLLDVFKAIIREEETKLKAQ